MSSISLPSSGQISLQQIRDLCPSVFSNSNISLRDMSAYWGLSTPDEITEFYGKTLTCTGNINSITYYRFSYIEDVVMTVSGGSSSFWYYANESWINVSYDSILNIITIGANEYNNPGRVRFGSVFMIHNDNPNVMHTVNIRQYGDDPV